MQVRRYEATTMKDAINAVKKDLGQNAVILSTKELPINAQGVKLYEVTAAASVQGKAGAEGVASQVTTDFAFGPELLSRLNDFNENMPNRSQMRLIEGAVHDIKSMLLEALRHQDNTKNAGAAHLFPTIRSLQLSNVDAGLIADVSKHLSSLPPPAEMLKTTDNVEAYYREQAMRWMLKRIRISPKWTATPGITNVHAFIGNPGAGKTTLLQKVATQIQKKERHKLALVTLGGAKIAAAEPTRIFSKIINVPHFDINQPTDLKKTVIGLKGVDIVLVDIPGFTSNDTAAVDTMAAIKELGLSLEFHLVASAAEKAAITERSIANLSKLGISSIAMSKLDETPAYGELFTHTAKWTLPISYLTFSANPADGIERATRERILERIFNL
jgi:flagellar biosynthesis protein FlhF